MAGPAVGASTASAVDRWAAARVPYLDNIKVLVVAAVIFMHAFVGYVGVAGEEWWPYAAVREVELGAPVTAALFAVAGPVALFMMALLFFVSGLTAGPSLRRQGPAAFAVDRLARLGVPYVAFWLLWPLLLDLMDRAVGRSVGYLDQLAAVFPSTGPLWFLGLLLLVSLGAALVAAVWGQAGAQRGPLGVRTLLLVAAAVAATTFLVRAWLPDGSPTPLELSEFQWPECVALFALGVAGSARGWARAIPAEVAHASGRVLAVTLVATAALGAMVGLLRVDVEQFLGGWHWQALALATIGGMLTVFGSIWLVAVAQSGLNRRVRHGAAWARSAFLAYVLQSFVLVGLALAVRGLPASAEVKATLVATGGIAGSFGLAWLLISRVPLIRAVF